jgi:hypothetical protein
MAAGNYISALVSELPRVKGWSIARQNGDRTPEPLCQEDIVRRLVVWVVPQSGQTGHP